MCALKIRIESQRLITILKYMKKYVWSKAVIKIGEKYIFGKSFF